MKEDSLQKMSIPKTMLKDIGAFLFKKSLRATNEQLMAER